MRGVPKPLTIIHEFSTSPNGKFLVFLSAKSAVNSGVHNATNSLHRIDWPTDGKLYQSANIYDIVSSSCGHLNLDVFGLFAGCIFF